MKKIKCGFVLSFNGPYYSNFVASIISLEKRLQQQEIETVYVFPRECKNFEWMRQLEALTDKIYYLEYKKRIFGNFFQIRKIFKKEKVNIIYSRMSGWDFPVRVAFPFLPVIWHMDMNVNVVDKKRRLLNLIKFKIIGFGKTYHIAASIPVAEAINSLKPKHKAVAIVNSLDFSRLHLKPESVLKKPYNFLIFGWSPIVKGVDIALEAFEQLNEKGISYRLLISSQPLTEEYINSKYGSEVPSFVELLPPTDTISELYDKADMMISASRSESFSFCLAEAIYSGLPVVFSDIEGTSWANEFKNTYIFKSGDAKDLVRAIREIPNHITPEALEYNRTLMQKKYSMEAWSSSIVDYIKEII